MAKELPQASDLSW